MFTIQFGKVVFPNIVDESKDGPVTRSYVRKVIRCYDDGHMTTFNGKGWEPVTLLTDGTFRCDSGVDILQ